MNVLPRACARLLLLSLLCATGLCQWSKSEWSCAGSVCHLPLGTVCVPVLGSRNTSPHVENDCRVLFLLFWGSSLATPLLFCSQFPLTRPNLHLSMGSAFLTPSHSSLCFPHP